MDANDEKVEVAARALAGRFPRVCAAVLGASNTLDGARALASTVLTAVTPDEESDDGE